MSDRLIEALERLRPVLQRWVIRQAIKDASVPEIWPSSFIPRGEAYEVDRALVSFGFGARPDGRVLLVNRDDYEAARGAVGTETTGGAE